MSTANSPDEMKRTADPKWMAPLAREPLRSGIRATEIDSRRVRQGTGITVVA